MFLDCFDSMCAALQYDVGKRYKLASILGTRMIFMKSYQKGVEIFIFKIEFE